MTTPMPLEALQLEDDLSQRVDQLAMRNAHVFGQPLPAKRIVAHVAKRYAADLTGRGRKGEDDAVAAAEEVSRYLVDDAEIGTPLFWRSDLGRAIAWHLGYAWHSAPQSHAAAILGVSRQAVSDAVGRGALRTAQDGGVERTSLRDYLRARARSRA